MTKLVRINDVDVTVKEYAGQRVLTLREIDKIHGRKYGTAENNYRANKKKFVTGADYFLVHLTDSEIKGRFGVSDRAHVVLAFTLSGYLMLVKSFTDDLAWKIQRELVNTYFKYTQTAVAPVPVSFPPEASHTNYFDITRSEEAVRALELITRYAHAVIEVCNMVKQKASVEKERQRAYSIVLTDLASEVGWHAHEFRNIKGTQNEKR